MAAVSRRTFGAVAVAFLCLWRNDAKPSRARWWDHARRANGELKHRCSAGIVFAVYKKTGYMLSMHWLELLASNRAERPLIHFDVTKRRVESGTIFGLPWTKELSADPSRPQPELHQVVEPSMEWPLPENMCVVHWMRNPVDMIHSGYKYHLSHMKSWHEDWLHKAFACSFCDNESHVELFKDCDLKVDGCTFQNMLNKAETRKSVYLESLRARRAFEDMWGNLQRWANNEAVLQVSVDMLRKDFNRTVECILHFIGYSGSSTRFKVLDFRTRPTSITSHWTHDDKQADFEIAKSYLQSEHPWSARFAEFNSLASSLNTC